MAEINKVQQQQIDAYRAKTHSKLSDEKIYNLLFANKGKKPVSTKGISVEHKSSKEKVITVKGEQVKVNQVNKDIKTKNGTLKVRPSGRYTITDKNGKIKYYAANGTELKESYFKLVEDKKAEIVKSSDGKTSYNLNGTIEKRINKLNKDIDRAEKDNSWIGKAWSGFKNLTGIGDSSDKVRQQAEKEKKLLAQYNNPACKNRDKIFEEMTGQKATTENKMKFVKGQVKLKSEQALSAYKEGQEMAVDVASDLVSGVASVGIYTAAVAAAPFTGGASIAVGVAAAGVAGGVTKSAVKHADAAARGKKYEWNASDMGYGALSGVLAPVTGGAGGAVAKSFAVRMGLQAAKDMGKAGVKTATKQGVKYSVKNGVKNKIVEAMMNPTGYTYTGGTAAKRLGAYAIEASVDGALSGAVDGGVRTAAEGGSAADIAMGAGMGLLMGGTMGSVMGAGMKVNGIIGHKAGVKAEPHVKVTSDKLKRRFTGKKTEVTADAPAVKQKNAETPAQTSVTKNADNTLAPLGKKSKSVADDNSLAPMGRGQGRGADDVIPTPKAQGASGVVDSGTNIQKTKKVYSKPETEIKSFELKDDLMASSQEMINTEVLTQNSNFSAKVINSKYAKNLDFNPIKPEDISFSMSDPYILDALPNWVIEDKSILSQLKQFEGKPLKDVDLFLSKLQKSTNKKDVSSKGSHVDTNGKVEVTPPTTPTTDLAELYAIELEKSAKISEKPDIMLEFAKRSRQGEFKGPKLLGMFLNAKYKNLRTANYKDFPFGLDKYTSQSKSNIRVKDENGWHYRISTSGTHKTKYRISINANGSKELVDLLDTFVNEKCYYKTPSLDADWAGRHDPITIYLAEKPTDEFCNKLVESLKKINGIRSVEDVLPGEKLTQGVTLLPETNHESILKIIDEYAAISPDFGEEVKIFVQKDANGNYKCSAGQYAALVDTLDILKSSKSHGINADNSLATGGKKSKSVADDNSLAPMGRGADDAAPAPTHADPLPKPQGAKSEVLKDAVPEQKSGKNLQGVPSPNDKVYGSPFKDIHTDTKNNYLQKVRGFFKNIFNNEKQNISNGGTLKGKSTKQIYQTLKDMKRVQIDTDLDISFSEKEAKYLAKMYKKYPSLIEEMIFSGEEYRSGTVYDNSFRHIKNVIDICEEKGIISEQVLKSNFVNKNDIITIMDKLKKYPDDIAIKMFQRAEYLLKEDAGKKGLRAAVDVESLLRHEDLAKLIELEAKYDCELISSLNDFSGLDSGFSDNVKKFINNEKLENFINNLPGKLDWMHEIKDGYVEIGCFDQNEKLCNYILRIDNNGQPKVQSITHREGTLSDKIITEFENGSKIIEDGYKKELHDADGKLIRKDEIKKSQVRRGESEITVTKPDKEGNLVEEKVGTVKINEKIDENGNHQVIHARKRVENPDGSISRQIKVFGKDRHGTVYKILDKDGNVQLDVKRGQWKIDENHYRSSHNGERFDIKYENDGITVSMIEGTGSKERLFKPIKISFDELDPQLLDLYKQLPGDYLYKLHLMGVKVKYEPKVDFGTNNLQDRSCYDPSTKTISMSERSKNNPEVFAHEYAHSVDDYLGLVSDPEYLKLSKQDWDDFSKISGQNERDKINYYTQNLNPADHSPNSELIAGVGQTIAGFSDAEDYMQIGDAILFQNYSRTIAYVGKKLEMPIDEFAQAGKKFTADHDIAAVKTQHSASAPKPQGAADNSLAPMGRGQGRGADDVTSTPKLQGADDGIHSQRARKMPQNPEPKSTELTVKDLKLPADLEKEIEQMNLSQTTLKSLMNMDKSMRDEIFADPEMAKVVILGMEESANAKPSSNMLKLETQENAASPAYKHNISKPLDADSIQKIVNNPEFPFNEQELDNLLWSWKEEMYQALEKTTGEEYQAHLYKVNEKYDSVNAMFSEKGMTMPEANEIFLQKVMPLTEDFQANIFGVVDNKFKTAFNVIDDTPVVAKAVTDFDPMNDFQNINSLDDIMNYSGNLERLFADGKMSKEEFDMYQQMIEVKMNELMSAPADQL